MIPEKFKKEYSPEFIAFRASKSLLEKIKEYAKKEKVSKSEIIRWAIESLFETIEGGKVRDN
jgi:predicted transcriptional regulator